jgi:hypothetical protein
VPGSRLIAAALALAASGAVGCSLWDRCDWREVRASCRLYDVDLRYDPARREVVAIAGYAVGEAPSAVRGGKEVRYRVPPGVEPARAVDRVRDYVTSHAALVCRWRTLVRGDCATDQVMVPLPGCPDHGTCWLRLDLGD